MQTIVADIFREEKIPFLRSFLTIKVEETNLQRALQLHCIGNVLLANKSGLGSSWLSRDFSLKTIDCHTYDVDGEILDNAGQ